MQISTIFKLSLALGIAGTVSAQEDLENILVSRDGGNVMQAGPNAQKLCEGLAISFKAPEGLTINNTFAQYFPEGSMPSIETLTETMPKGTIPADVKIPKILDSVGPDADLKSQAGYGRLNGRASKNGPIGGMPAFCRIGAQIATSSLSSVYSEVWLPLASDPKIPLVAPDKNFPTNTTPYEIGNNGKFALAPLYYLKGWYKVIKPSPYAHKPPQPNDVPAPPEEKKEEKKGETENTPTTSNKKTKRSTSSCPVTNSIPGDKVLGGSDGWNGRIAVTGNGGQLGFPVYPTMKNYMGRYGFAVAGTNLGHFSNLAGVTWVNGTQFTETLTDFGYRANHVTLLLAESIVEQFYGPKEGIRNPKENNRLFRYYFASSVGGARGLSAAQQSSTVGDFDGILVGAPALSFQNMGVGQIHTASIHNVTVVGKDAFFTQGALYGPIKDVVTSQCDALDGVSDGIISAPDKCKPNLEKELLCGTNTKYGKSNGTCLTQAQISNVYELYKPTVLEGKIVYPAYWPGLEDSASSFRSTNAKASGWYQLVTLRSPKLDPKFNPFKDIRLADLEKGVAADPGGVDAAKTDLSEFVKRGGKLMMYHGSYDIVVSPQSTIDYFTAAKKDTAAALKVDESEVAKSIKFYPIWGMHHSRGGPGATNFGGPSQNDPGNRPYKFETQYDMTLALIAWAEKGVEPQAQIAARYKIKEAIMPDRDAGKGDEPSTDLYIPTSQQNYNWGLVNTRLLCPWPLNAVYQKGKSANGEDGHEAFECA